MIESLDKNQVKEYQRIYKNCFEEELSETEAYQQGLKLVKFISTILVNIKINNKEYKDASL